MEKETVIICTYISQSQDYASRNVAATLTKKLQRWKQNVNFFCVIFFLGPQVWHMELPRLGVKWELQLLAYTTATATMDLSSICGLHHSSQQCQILSPLSEARNQTQVPMDTSWVPYHWATVGTSVNYFLYDHKLLNPGHAPQEEFLWLFKFIPENTPSTHNILLRYKD